MHDREVAMNKPKRVSALLAINCRYLGPTNFKGSRVVATTANGHRKVVPFDDTHGRVHAYQLAAVALARELGWLDEDRLGSVSMAVGSMPKGYVFVFADRDATFTASEV